MVQFYLSITESIFTSSFTMWYAAAATAKDKGRWQHGICSAKMIAFSPRPVHLQD